MICKLSIRFLFFLCVFIEISGSIFGQNDQAAQLMTVAGDGTITFSLVPNYSSSTSVFISGTFYIQVPCVVTISVNNVVGAWTVGGEITETDIASAGGCNLGMDGGTCLRQVSSSGNFISLGNTTSGTVISLFTITGKNLCNSQPGVILKLLTGDGTAPCGAISSFSIDGDGIGAQLPNSAAYTGADPGTQSTTCALLPIELLSFSAKNKQTHIALDWATASEINNDRFIIERSADGAEFESIATVDGAGTSSQVLEYSYNDLTPIIGMNYYRLVNVDFDETRHISPTRSVHLHH